MDLSEVWLRAIIEHGETIKHGGTMTAPQLQEFAYCMEYPIGQRIAAWLTTLAQRIDDDDMYAILYPSHCMPASRHYIATVERIARAAKWIERND